MADERGRSNCLNDLNCLNVLNDIESLERHLEG
jgi:hypothetical protein